MNIARRAFVTTAVSAGRAGLAALARIGLIGCGGRSRDLLEELVKANENAAITAVCDGWRVNREQRSAAITQAFGAEPKQTTRYQELLGDEGR